MKERVASFLGAKLKEEGRKEKRVKNAPGRDKSWESLEDCDFPYAYDTKLAVRQRSNSRIAEKDGDDGEVAESGSASEKK